MRQLRNDWKEVSIEDDRERSRTTAVSGSVSQAPLAARRMRRRAGRRPDFEPLTPSQVAARDLVDRQDREYEEARMQDLQRSPPEEEATPASVSDPVGDEPSAGEMRRARLRRFGLPSH